jgi:hypothetical protein
MKAITLLALVASIGVARSAEAQSTGRPVPLDPARLQLHGVAATTVTHEGRAALRLVEAGGRKDGGLALVESLTFQDGEIAIDVAGRRGAFAIPDDRGFVGVAFRIAADVSRYEHVYLRPDNGRADDQIRRNHSAQYASHPEFPWPVLRKSFPEKYESYVDLQPGAWTSMRIVARGNASRLYVHGSEQPTLVVNDLKLTPAPGGVALWIGPGTEAFFANLRVNTAAPASPARP